MSTYIKYPTIQNYAIDFPSIRLRLNSGKSWRALHISNSSDLDISDKWRFYSKLSLYKIFGYKLFFSARNHSKAYLIINFASLFHPDAPN